MMKFHTYLIICAAAVAVLSSCGKDIAAQEQFQGVCQEAGLTIGGSQTYEFSTASVQMSFNESKKQFRVFDDGMRNYYVVTVDKIPSGEGSAFTADLVWTTATDVRKRSGVKFKVIRVSQDLLWCWNKKDDIGVVVRLAR